MGNISDKPDYKLINNPINSENDCMTETLIANKSLPSLIADITKSNNIIEVFKNYDDETILDYYKSDSIIEILLFLIIILIYAIILINFLRYLMLQLELVIKILLLIKNY